jgi:5-formyltetrahydrofolate cyclo-ligase
MRVTFLATFVLFARVTCSVAFATVPHHVKSQLCLSTFDEDAYEQDRLNKDAQAMNTMKEKAEEEFSKLRTPWKWVIRKRIWDLLEAKDIARPPRPVHHRIPNFDGADRAAARLSSLPEFIEAKCVKVNPDTPSERRAISSFG